ncbi:MAG: hypothetical protein HYZ58_06720 [Acidobacteria bacterium]|nr:hypothetical protein [Acidobacteriota bacterium]
MSQGLPEVIRIEVPRSPDELEEARRRKREQKRIEDSTRPLESWERYRALNDATDEAYELIDIADREARFALIIMGALNAALFVIGTRLDIVKTIPDGGKPWMIAAFAAYGLVLLYFFIAAIETLRPRGLRTSQPTLGEGHADHHPLGVRHYEHVVRRDARSLAEAWREVTLRQLNTELAIHVHGLCVGNKAKHAALHRLYDGLRIMTFIVAALLMMLGLFAFTGSAEPNSAARSFTSF